jgi:GMP synthase-like glutamine amidotransferase
MRTAATLVAAGTATLSLYLLLQSRWFRRLLRRSSQQRRIAFLNTEPAEKWSDHLSIFAVSLGIPVARFDNFRCYEGEFPSSDALVAGDYVGVLVTGSHHSSKDPDLEWLPLLFECLRTCERLPHVNVLGICFGCQATAVALGGDVGRNPCGSFVFCGEKICLHTQVLQEAVPEQTLKAAGGAIGSRGTITLLESHGEQVTRLPPGAYLLGSSPSTPHEIFVAGRHRNFLALQSHPEVRRPLPAARTHRIP